MNRYAGQLRGTVIFPLRLSARFPGKGNDSQAEIIWNAILRSFVKRHVGRNTQSCLSSLLDELSTLLHGCGCAPEVCVISPVGANFAISRGTKRGPGEDKGATEEGRGGETGRVMYYRTEIDYWKRYQSYKHSLPLILQSCDVEPSHRRPSLLIPPPAIPSPFAFSPSSSPPPLLAFLSVRLPSPQISSPSSCFSHSLRRYVMECTGCPASTDCPFRSEFSTNSAPLSFPPPRNFRQIIISYDLSTCVALNI